MNKRIVSNDLSEKRMLSRDEASEYIGLGRTSTIAFCQKIGAVKHVGRRALYDRFVIDKAFNEMDSDSKEGAEHRNIPKRENIPETHVYLKGNHNQNRK